jgi:hypothetical protein
MDIFARSWYNPPGHGEQIDAWKKSAFMPGRSSSRLGEIVADWLGRQK